jgi:translation initiation factor IF-3
LALARERDLDLVEVAPTSVPPVCRLLDYGKFKYLQSTKEREMRRVTKTISLREVRFRPRTGPHDLESKERVVDRLLEKGAKVKVSVVFRGREQEHPELGMNLLRQMAEGLKEKSKLEQAPRMEGRFMSIVLAPVKTNTRAVPPQSKEIDELTGDAQAEDT